MRDVLAGLVYRKFIVHLRRQGCSYIPEIVHSLSIVHGDLTGVGFSLLPQFFP